MSETALKPCPFCGSPANYFAYGNDKHQIDCNNPTGCPLNVCTFTHRTKNACVAAWNTRAESPDEQLNGAVAALQKANKNAAHLLDENDRLRSENARLLKTLHFYSDQWRQESKELWSAPEYNRGHSKLVGVKVNMLPTYELMEDAGQRARAALAGTDLIT